ncbi:ATPase H(+)-transporting accessory protein 2 isoform X2 [Prorops nasuta]|uniref:ATPase H(+)-transporting accessory protein 2 isoform X2 n=1 Tax=Prorops nasuta TaxID=863751 RepID=UPI0034CFDA23
MKERMFRLLLFCVITFATAYAGELIVLHSPNSVTFSGNEEIEQSLLTEVFAAALGLTVKQRGKWSGISILNPFEPPEAVVGIAVEGVDFLNSPRGHKFPLIPDEFEETSWQAFSGRIDERYTDNDNKVVRIYLGDGVDALGQSAIGELKLVPVEESSLRALNLENEVDRKFYEEIQLIHAIAKKISSNEKAESERDTMVGLYWLVVSQLRAIYDQHGKNSEAAMEALHLLNNALNTLSEAFIDLYDGKVLIVAFTNNPSQVRNTRSIPSTRVRRQVTNTTQDDQQEQSKDKADEEEVNIVNRKTNETISEINNPVDREGIDKSNNTWTEMEHKTKTNTQKIGQGGLNLAKEYNEDYPVIFNIMLWFGVIFVFSLLAICITIADMDPGRDSIIYRMTSNRMKKDN